jgi:hypothetical protein
MPTDPSKLCELATWYREIAERAGNPTIWEAQLHTAEDLETPAALIERGLSTTTAEEIAYGRRL